MLDKYAIPTEVAYLPDDFSPEDNQTITQLVGIVTRHLSHDEDTSISMPLVHQVAKTLVDADCDARTVMVFFLSVLDTEERRALADHFPNDMLEAARNIAIIRLLSPKDNPRHLPIRKVLLRQLVLKVTHDVRVIVVKIAGRLVWLRNAAEWEPELRKRLAREAIDVVVPWCDALGLENWRQELQELSFKYLQPEQYNRVIAMMEDHRDTLFDVKDQVIRELTDLLDKHKIEAAISGRVKTHYAVYRKMQAYEISYDEIWDRIGIRILTRSVFDCYYIQMAIEEDLYTDRRRYVDYIETPRKPYNYQSLHLTVCGPKDTMVEIQIRTFDMHIKGEYGVAAHWKMYGGGDGANSSEDIKFAFLRTQASQLLGDPMEYLGNTLDELLFNNSILPNDTGGYLLDPEAGQRIIDSRGQQIHYRNVVTDSKGYVLDPYTNKHIMSEAGEPIWYQSDVLPDRVIVYTPTGDLRSLPAGATPLDFAYYIHEEIGHTCIGAKINGKMAKLDQPLQLGDQVDIVTRKGSTPSMDWLHNGFTQTKRAKEKIKRFFREKTDIVPPEVHELGLSIIKKRLSAHKIKELPLEKLAEMMKCKSVHDLVEQIGATEITVSKLDDVLGEYLLEQLAQDSLKSASFRVLPSPDFDFHSQQAQCCYPLPGDDTISYITLGRGFTLHRADCRNVATMDADRMSPYEWKDQDNTDKRYYTKLIALVVQPSKSILYIKEIVSIDNVPIESIKAGDSREKGTYLNIILKVANKAQLERVTRRMDASDDILMVRRANG